MNIKTITKKLRATGHRALAKELDAVAKDEDFDKEKAMELKSVILDRANDLEQWASQYKKRANKAYTAKNMEDLEEALGELDKFETDWK